MKELLDFFHKIGEIKENAQKRLGDKRYKES